jgi:hypothetical protein
MPRRPAPRDCQDQQTEWLGVNDNPHFPMDELEAEDVNVMVSMQMTESSFMFHPSSSHCRNHWNMFDNAFIMATARTARRELREALVSTKISSRDFQRWAFLQKCMDHAVDFLAKLERARTYGTRRNCPSGFGNFSCAGVVRRIRDFHFVDRARRRATCHGRRSGD